MKTLKSLFRYLSKTAAPTCRICDKEECQCCVGVEVDLDFKTTWFVSAPLPFMESYAKRKRRP